MRRRGREREETGGEGAVDTVERERERESSPLYPQTVVRPAML